VLFRSNGDGIWDLAVANSSSNDVSVLLGNGDGTFQPARQFAAGHAPTSLAVADLNGDAVPDLAVAKVNSNDVSVLLGNGDGTFQPARNFAAGNFPAHIVVADFNGDNRPDLAVTIRGVHPGFDNAVLVFQGNGDGSFQPVQTFATGFNSRGIAVGDFNRDKKPDLVVANQFSNDVSILINNTR